MDKPNFGNVYGVVCEDSLVVFTYALNITDSEEKHDNTELQWSMPAEVDFCGVLCIDEEPDVSKLLKVNFLIFVSNLNFIKTKEILL